MIIQTASRTEMPQGRREGGKLKKGVRMGLFFMDGTRGWRLSNEAKKDGLLTHTNHGTDQMYSLCERQPAPVRSALSTFHPQLKF